MGIGRAFAVLGAVGVLSSCEAIDWTGNRLADVTEAGMASNEAPLACG